MVQIEIPAPLQPLCGEQTVEVSGGTLGEALRALQAAHPALGARLLPGGRGLAPDVDAHLDGKELRLRGGLQAPLPDGARVSLQLRRARLQGPQADRYARQVVLPEVGPEGQERLAEAKVLVVGAGGLGAPVLTYLAAAGVGHIGIVDGDVVERSNLHRQPIHRDRDVGTNKAESARRFLLELRPEADVTVYPVYLTAENALGIFSGYDLIVNGSDNFPTRYLLSDAATLLARSWVDASILRFEGQVAVYLPGGGCYRCLFPSPPPAGSVPSCAEAGVIGALAGQIGSMQALEAAKLILGAGESLAGRLLVVDALMAQQRSFPILRDPQCPVCGDHPTQRTLVDYEALCGSPMPGAAVRRTASVEMEEARALLAQPHVQWLDVRPACAGPRETIPGARWMPLEELAGGELALDPAREVVAFCDIGRRSLLAVDILFQRGFAVRSVEGGLLAWRAAGLPLQEQEP